MIVVTGAAGFIGSCMVSRLNQAGITDLLLVDAFDRDDRAANLVGKQYKQTIDRDNFLDWLEDNAEQVEFVFHLGARTDTGETDRQLFDELNLNYSKQVFNICTGEYIPILYASSAATYGLGEKGYSDDNQKLEKLKPLNEYARSKHEFDKWAVKQVDLPPYWMGLKFFNVYGPNEYHKGSMASVVYHAYQQLQQHGEVKLFKSHNPQYKDGEQARDFIYVKDVVEVMLWIYENRPQSGIYNLGTGKARTFLDLAKATFKALDREPNISFVDTPERYRKNYQYFTEADMGKLRAAGYTKAFHSLEEGVKNYVQQYLAKGSHY